MLIDHITENQMDVMRRYIEAYAFHDGISPTVKVPMEELLRPWAENKVNLFKLFGEQLILSKEVSFTKSKDTLCHDINETFFWDGASREWEFITAYNDLTRRTGPLPYNYRVQGLLDPWWLANGTYEDDNFEILVPNGKSIQVKSGMKIMKLLGKIAKAYDLPGFEEFRIAHSQILNQKKLTGTLSLSIHPFDYMTMSHNACDWNSCMDWTEEGCYRRGTIEMMNSPCVIVAYLNSANSFYPLYGSDFEWSNKKWRELFIINKDLITGIKPYPYANKDLSHEVMNWLRELAGKNMSWNYFDNIHTYNLSEKAYNVDLDTNIIFHFYTNAMYNDFATDHEAYISTEYQDEDEHSGYSLNYSGPSQCMCCGSISTYFDGESALVCEECDTSIYCNNCGERYDENEMVTLTDGRMVCESCYDHYTSTCAICEGRYMDGDMISIHLSFNGKQACRDSYAVVCYDCCQKLRAGKYTHLFNISQIRERQIAHSWRRIRYFHVNDITDEGAKVFEYENRAEMIKDLKHKQKTNDDLFYVLETEEEAQARDL